MKIVMYGAGICPDCVRAEEQLIGHKDVQLDYRKITKDTKTLKEFLSYRDHEPMFAAIIEKGQIGIPFFILEDGTKTFDIYDYVNVKKLDVKQGEGSCSFDGKGSC